MVMVYDETNEQIRVKKKKNDLTFDVPPFLSWILSPTTIDHESFSQYSLGL